LDVLRWTLASLEVKASKTTQTDILVGDISGTVADTLSRALRNGVQVKARVAINARVLSIV
jgi:hypothetical protein